jgi:hypothetical protein
LVKADAFGNHNGRKDMKHISRSGSVLAAAALAMAVSGPAFTTAPAQAASKVMCFGVNACKGQAACKSGSNSCKGQNACKGQGWISATAAQCKAWGGKVG